MEENRIKFIEEETHKTNIEVHVIRTKLESVEKMIETFVTRPEFHPIKMIVYGMVGSILLTALGAMLAQVIK